MPNGEDQKLQIFGIFLVTLHGVSKILVRVCVCVSVRVCVRERESVCVCVCVSKKDER